MSEETPSRVKSIIGNTYHNLTVVSFERKQGAHTYWGCVCVCGNTRIVEKAHLRTGHTKSCGCMSSRSTIGKRNFKHGLSNTPIYNTWSNIKQRCFDPSYKEFHLYGGRGITMCDKWRLSFAAFYADMGDIPEGMEIDRKDNNGDYTPDNCRWATASRNCRNRRTTRMLTYMGETMSASDWGDRVGISSKVIRQRIDKQGWSVEKALTTPTNLPHYLHFKNRLSNRRGEK